MPDPASWEDLYVNFLLLLRLKNQSIVVMIMFYLFTEHPYWKAQEPEIARRILPKGDRSKEAVKQVLRDAKYELWQRLRRKPDLGFDQTIDKKHFPGWVKSVIESICSQGLWRRELRRTLAEAKLPRLRRDPDDVTPLLDMGIDVRAAIANLDPDTLKVLEVLADKPTEVAVARALGITRRAARRQIAKARAKAKALLSGY